MKCNCLYCQYKRGEVKIYQPHKTYEEALQEAIQKVKDKK